MNLLFVCKHNRFRSKVAEELFNFYDGGKNEAKSAGIFLDPINQYVAENVYFVLGERGLRIKNEKARVVDREMIDWADKIIVVANDVDLELFPREKTEVWRIGDADEADLIRIKKIIDEIDDNVKKLLNIEL